MPVASTSIDRPGATGLFQCRLKEEGGRGMLGGVRLTSARYVRARPAAVGIGLPSQLFLHLPLHLRLTMLQGRRVPTSGFWHSHILPSASAGGGGRELVCVACRSPLRQGPSLRLGPRYVLGLSSAACGLVRKIASVLFCCRAAPCVPVIASPGRRFPVDLASVMRRASATPSTLLGRYLGMVRRQWA